jgi:hypothetical protein
VRPVRKRARVTPPQALRLHPSQHRRNTASARTLQAAALEAYSADGGPPQHAERKREAAEEARLAPPAAERDQLVANPDQLARHRNQRHRLLYARGEKPSEGPDGIGGSTVVRAPSFDACPCLGGRGPPGLDTCLALMDELAAHMKMTVAHRPQFNSGSDATFHRRTTGSRRSWS